MRPPLAVGRLFSRLLIGLAIGVALYAAGVIYLGARDLAASLARFQPLWLLPILALTLANYTLRYAKWALYLRALQIQVPRGRNALIFASGLSMTITPGKIGELLKAYLLRVTDEVPMSRTAPVVLAERVTDLVALLLLMVTGVGAFPAYRTTMFVAGAVVTAFIVLLGWRSAARGIFDLGRRVRLVERFVPPLEKLYESTATLFRPRPLLVATSLSLAAWACECLGFYLVVGGFGDAGIGVMLATFIYSATTVGGTPTPGGLGLTESGMAALLHFVGHVPRSTAGAATLIIRLCTLWFAVFVGAVALLVVRRGNPMEGPANITDLSEEKDADQTGS